MDTRNLDTRVEALEAALGKLRKETAEAKTAAKETHDAVQALVEALLKPQPGHERSLLDRVAQVTIRAERGEWMLRLLIWLLGTGATVAAAWAGFRTWTDGG